MRTLLAVAIALWISGCRVDSEHERKAKLEQVRAAAVRRATGDDREAFAASVPFQNLEGLDMAVVGLRVPLSGATKNVFVTFTVDYFDSTSVERLAAEALADYARAKAVGPEP